MLHLLVHLLLIYSLRTVRALCDITEGPAFKKEMTKEFSDISKVAAAELLVDVVTSDLVACVSPCAELRAEVDVIEQMSSSGSSSSSDSASASGSDDDSSSEGERHAQRPLSQTSPNRHPVANGGADRQQGNNQLMNTLSE